MRLNFLEATHEGLIYAHDSSVIIEFATVVGGRKYCDEFAPCEKLVSVLLHLVATRYKVYIELLGEIGDYVVIEDIADAAFTFLIFWVLVLLGVRPQ